MGEWKSHPKLFADKSVKNRKNEKLASIPSDDKFRKPLATDMNSDQYVNDQFGFRQVENYESLYFNYYNNSVP